MTHARLCDSPSISLLKGLLLPEEVEHLLALSADDPSLARARLSTVRDAHGTSLKLPTTLDPVLGAISARIVERVQLPGVMIPSLTWRIRHEGDELLPIPAHLDPPPTAGVGLVATVLITVRRPEQGGQSRFAHARERALELLPDVGDALLWYHVADDLEHDPRSSGEELPVLTGVKITLMASLYAPLDGLTAIQDRLAMAPQPRERLYLLTDRDRGELEDQLHLACMAQGVSLIEIDVATFDHVATPPLEDGAMLYRTATSHEAHVVEQLLAHPRVATFYSHPLGAHIIHDNQSLLLARCGIETPRAVFVLTTNKAELRQIVDHLGGFPIILKVPGRSLGIGVMRLNDFPALFSVVDQVYATQGKMATLMSCIEPARHWRVIVVGQTQSSYLNLPREDDFRTHVDEGDTASFSSRPPEAVLQIAHDACAVLGFETGGVDVLEHESGRVYVLEVNFPCYFGHPRGAGGEDVAAMMLDHLRAKSSRLRS